MVRRARFGGAAIGAASLLAASLVAGPAGAAFDFGDTGWEGTSQLLEVARKQLGRHRVEIRARLDWSEMRPADGILILHPEVAIGYDEASGFMRAGGRIAILDDYGRGAELLERFHIHRIPAPLRPSRTLRRNASLALAFPAVQQVAGYEQGRHPVVAHAKQVVTNHPTALTHPDLTPVLRIPAVREPDATLAVTGIIVNRGRLFAMGDPSCVINLMMRYPGNRAFAQGLVGYLVEDDTWGKRGGRLFLVSNTFDQSGQYGRGTSLTREIEAHISGFRQMLDDARVNGLPDVVAVLLAALAGLVTVAWMALVASRTYRRLLPRFARPVPLVAQGGIAGRAAVLAAPSTHKALAMVELKGALEEGLALRLHLDGRVATEELRKEIDRQSALSRRSSEKLDRMMRELAEAETAVAASQPIRISARMVERMRVRVRRILDEVGEKSEGHR